MEIFTNYSSVCHFFVINLPLKKVKLGLASYFKGDIMNSRNMIELSSRLAFLTIKNAPHQFQQNLLKLCFLNNPNSFLDILGPALNRKPDLDHMKLDFDDFTADSFESLSGLFSSNSLNHGVISMTIRDTAFLFGFIRRHKPKSIAEIGRYKGGSTIVIASAMQEDAKFLSIDIGEKEARLSSASREFDTQIKDFLSKLNKEVNLLVGDSKSIQLPTRKFDLVFIDGDHSYSGVKADFDRFSKQLKMGGFIFLDDVYSSNLAPGHKEVRKYVNEILSKGKFKLYKKGDRLACLQRIR